MKNNKTTSEFRPCYLSNEGVIISTGRDKRPNDINKKTSPKCQFCPAQIKKEAVVEKIKVGKISIISEKNKYPVLSLRNKKAYGTQEVIIETQIHEQKMADFSEKHIAGILKMYIKRTKALSKIPGINYILCFKNDGAAAGASLSHSHSQIFASGIIPQDLKKEAEHIAKRRLGKNSCPYCDIVKKESKSPRRIFSDKHIAAFSPYASRFNYEAWIFTQRHVDNITLLTESEIKSLARAIKMITSKIQKLGFSYNYFLHNVVSDPNQHFYVKIQPRHNIWAGLELGSGLVINSVSPEDAAAYYRNKK